MGLDLGKEEDFKMNLTINPRKSDASKSRVNRYEETEEVDLNDIDLVANETLEVPESNPVEEEEPFKAE